MIRAFISLVLGGLIGFGTAVWFQGEFPFAGASAPGKYDFAIIISDAYLTSQAAPQIAKGTKGQIVDVKFTSSKGNTIDAEGRTSIGGLPVGVILTPHVSPNGAVTISADNPHVGPVFIFDQSLTPVVTTINQRLQTLIPPKYKAVRVETVNGGVQVFLGLK